MWWKRGQKPTQPPAPVPETEAAPQVTPAQQGARPSLESLADTRPDIRAIIESGDSERIEQARRIYGLQQELLSGSHLQQPQQPSINQPLVASAQPQQEPANHQKPLVVSGKPALELPSFTQEERARIQAITPPASKPVFVSGATEAAYAYAAVPEPETLQRMALEKLGYSGERLESAMRSGALGFGRGEGREFQAVAPEEIYKSIQWSDDGKSRSLRIDLPPEEYEKLASGAREPEARMTPAQRLIDVMQHPEKYPKHRGVLLAEFENLPDTLYQVAPGIDEALYALAEPQLKSTFATFAAISVALNDRLREARSAIGGLAADLRGDKQEAQRLLDEGSRSLESSREAVGQELVAASSISFHLRPAASRLIVKHQPYAHKDSIPVRIMSSKIPLDLSEFC